MARVITLEEVKKHKEANDLWMIIENKVYSLSAFLKEHPGGEEPLLENAGKDSTKEFIEVGHSKEAEEIMKKYYIGDLAISDRNKENIFKKHGKDIGIAIVAVAVGFLAVYLIKRTLKH